MGWGFELLSVKDSEFSLVRHRGRMEVHGSHVRSTTIQLQLGLDVSFTQLTGTDQEGLCMAACMVRVGLEYITHYMVRGVHYHKGVTCDAQRLANGMFPQFLSVIFDWYACKTCRLIVWQNPMRQTTLAVFSTSLCVLPQVRGGFLQQHQ